MILRDLRRMRRRKLGLKALDRARQRAVEQSVKGAVTKAPTRALEKAPTTATQNWRGVLRALRDIWEKEVR